MALSLDSPISKVPLVGPKYANKLKKLGINKARDLLYHFPHRYQDYSLVSDISRAQPGETVTIRGQIVKIKNVYTRVGKRIQNAQVSDGEGKVEVTWFNQPFLVKTLPPGTWVSLSGKVNWYGRKKILVSPEYEKLTRRLPSTDYGTVHTGRLVPIYPETSGVSSKWLRSRIAWVLPEVLPQLEEFLPEEILRENNFLEIKEAIKKIHFPKTLAEAEEARKRLSFDELFWVQLRALARKRDWKKKQLAHKLDVDQEKVLQFLNNLPFTLTPSQKRSAREILKDLAQDQPMNRLLEGDVGSGKTVVAALATYISYINGFQAAFMAPTQILASQHYQTLHQVLEPLGVKVKLVTGGRKTENGRQRADVIVGTHALIQKNVDFDNLALVIIDEQHRFGVAQRALLAKKGKGKTPHVLTMTATPIPRTVALTLYGDLDLSTLDELPKGRLAIKTWVVPPQKREAAYRWIRDRVKETDEQAFIVCPLIEESEFETMKSVKAATAEHERLSKKIFPDLSLGLLHGRLKQAEKDKVMGHFRKGKYDILVATPVVEVGIDIPNATIMMIEGAERFGLAQLHQLRGRVGRGSKQSCCLLFTESSGERVLTRLQALEKTLSGRELAELDLKLRGPGEVYGTRQHGFPELKIASFSDIELIRAAREAAQKFINHPKRYPKLKEFVDKQLEEVAPN